MKVTLCIGMLCLAFHAMAQQHLFVADQIQTRFFSEARLENIEATSVSGSAAVIDAESGEVAFKISILSFRFRHKLMEEHFNENYMESDKFPYATFKGKMVEKVDLKKEGSYRINVEGILTVHGISKNRTFSGVIVNKDGKLYLDSEFMLPVSDHKIDIPNDKLSNISQTIKVSVHAEFIPKK